MPSMFTLRRIIAAHSNFPFIAHGKGGRGYVIDLDEAERFVRDVQSFRIIDPARRAAAIEALGLDTLADAERTKAG